MRFSDVAFNEEEERQELSRTGRATGKGSLDRRFATSTASLHFASSTHIDS